MLDWMGWCFCSLLGVFLLDTCIAHVFTCIHMRTRDTRAIQMRYMYSRRSLENTCDTCILRNTSSRYIAIQYRNTYSAYVLRRTALCTAAHEGMGLRRVRGQHRRVCVRLQGLQGLLYGICSHLLAINHILKHFNVRYQLHGIGTSNRSKSGPGQGRLPNPEPALQRARIAREPDSSDEEQERVLELGRQGK